MGRSRAGQPSDEGLAHVDLGAARAVVRSVRSGVGGTPDGRNRGWLASSSQGNRPARLLGDRATTMEAASRTAQAPAFKPLGVIRQSASALPWWTASFTTISGSPASSGDSSRGTILGAWLSLAPLMAGLLTGVADLTVRKVAPTPRPHKLITNQSVIYSNRVR